MAKKHTNKVKTDYDRELFVTVKEMIALSGKAANFVRAAIEKASLDSVAAIETGKVGRPGFVYDRKAFQEALDKHQVTMDANARVRQEEAAKKTLESAIAAQTNSEVPTQDSVEFDGFENSALDDKSAVG